MLHYKVYQNNSKNTKLKGKWFARAAVIDTINLEQLSEHMANHNTPYSKGAIYGVLTDMVGCIRELVLEGNAVKIPNLAIFSLGLTTKGADDRDKFGAENVKSVHLRARSTGDFTRAELTRAAKLRNSNTLLSTDPTTAAPTTAALRRAVPRRAAPRRAAPRPATPTRRSSRGALGDNF